MERVKITVEGITPLLFNRFNQASIEGDSPGKPGTKKRSGAVLKNDYTEKLYRLPDGKIYTPANHITGCLINAGKNFKIMGKGKASYSKLLGSVVEVEDEALIHKIQDYDSFTTTAVNPMTKGRIVITRPIMRKWSFDFVLKIADDGLPANIVKQILDYGGLYVGIGDWRPDKKGKYGKFMVTKFEEL